MLDPFLRRMVRDLGLHAARLFRLENDLFHIGYASLSLNARLMAREAHKLVFLAYEGKSGRSLVDRTADTVDRHAADLAHMGMQLRWSKRPAYAALCERLSGEAIKIASTIQERTPTRWNVYWMKEKDGRTA